MRVVKMKEVEMVCKGTSSRPGCGSTLAVTAEDLKTVREPNIDCDGDCVGYVYKRQFTCPICGAKTIVSGNFLLTSK